LRTIILTPVYNDWESLRQLKIEIKAHLPDNSYSLMVVDDGSTTIPNAEDFVDCKIIALNQNQGHQRAIAVGLCYIQDQMEEDIRSIVVMDSDGEDKPSDIIKILSKCSKSGSVVFASRLRRQETLIFKFLYVIYKGLFKILVGQNITFGNFCAIPIDKLSKITSNPDLWNHFSGSIIKSKINFNIHKCDRGARYAGKSKMNLVSLIIHGLSSISIQLEVVAVRIMMLSAVLGSFVFIAFTSIIIVRVTTDWLVPGWTSISLILLILLTISVFGISMLFCLSILISRNTMKLPPISFYRNFINFMA